MPLRRPALGLAALLAACAPPPPPAAPPAPVPRAVTAPPPPAVASPDPSAPLPPLPPPPSPRPPLPRAEPITEPLPPLERRFATVTLPGVKAGLVSVDGRGDRDIWFLANEERPSRSSKYTIEVGVVVHYDGRRVDRRLVPDCYGAQFGAVHASGHGVVVTGMNPFVRAPMWEIAQLAEGKGKAWTCTNAYSDVRAAPGGDLWALSCGSMDGRRCGFRAEGGRRAPFPVHHRGFGADGADTPLRPEFWEMRGPADGWMILADEDGQLGLHRYNGVAWALVAPLEGITPTAFWVDEESRAFIAASGVLLRSDGRAFTAIPVPAGFEPSLMVGRSARDLWFFGKGQVVYHWDGHRFQQGESPFLVGGAWAAPGGEVWIVGQGGEGTSTSPPGVVGRAPAAMGVR